MRQQPLSGFDDATTMAAFASRAVQIAALPELPVSLPALPPAVMELLELIKDGLVAVPGPAESPVDSFPGALPVAGFGAAPPEQGQGHISPAELDIEIVPLRDATMPLSLHDQDLFGSASVSPYDTGETTLPVLFRGFQLDLFGDAQAPDLPGFEVTIGTLPGPVAPPSVEPGKVTMFEGQSEFELDPELVQSLLDENGRLVVEGDGDDVVILGATWAAAGSAPDAEGYTYYVESGSGLAVGIRGADILLV